MRDQIPNAAWGVLDYAAYPVAMLLAAPSLLHHLGTAQYGVWIVCTAAISTGGIIASGFGDANIQHVASQRALQPSTIMDAPGPDSRTRVSRDRATAPAHSPITTAVRNMIGINATLGLAITLIALALIPLFAKHVGNNSAAPLTLAAFLMFIRAIESVCISTQRAFERYGRAVFVSILTRILTIAAAVVLTRFHLGVASIMLFTFAAVILGTIIQLAQLKTLLAAHTLTPRFDREAFRALFGFGIFSWLQAISTVLFSQADRLILAAALGATAVTSYTLCVQLAQPIYGISAAALHFLFPYLAARQTQSTARPVLIAFLLNFVYTAITAGTLFFFGNAILYLWLGADIATAATPVLAPIVLSFALLSLSVPAYYALLAFARIRAVTAINLIGGLSMLAVLANATTLGLRGILFGRILYGLIALAMYLPLLAALRKQATTRSLPLMQEIA